MLLGRIPLVRRQPRGPISLVGSTEGNAIDGTDLTLSLPGGLRESDVVYVMFGISTTAGGGTTSPGWTQIGSTVDNTVRTQVFRKVMGYTPDAQIVLTGSASATNGCAGIAYGFRGVDIVSPEDQTATTATGTSAAAPDSPSITTQTANAWVISFGCKTGNDPTVVAPTGYSNQVDDVANDTTDVTVGAATKLVAAAGAEDPAEWTTWTANVAWAAWSIAVRSAPI